MAVAVPKAEGRRVFALAVARPPAVVHRAPMPLERMMVRLPLAERPSERQAVPELFREQQVWQARTVSLALPPVQRPQVSQRVARCREPPLAVLQLDEAQRQPQEPLLAAQQVSMAARRGEPQRAGQPWAQPERQLVWRRALALPQPDARAWPWQPPSQPPRQLPVRRARGNACGPARRARYRASSSASSFP
ncbi:MAG TPA: hypothetical protein VMM16_00565 [Verrucomicrobiae bacterium]|nr:hypothetical protein [Verrucomicrobiae bacterium]